MQEYVSTKGLPSRIGVYQTVSCFKFDLDIQLGNPR